MKLPNLPSVDDAWAYLLGLAPFPATIVALILLARTLYGWYDTLRKAAERSRSAADAAGSAFARMRTMPSSAIGVAVAASLLTLIAQGIWLACNFLVGNVLSGALGVNHKLHGLDENIVPTWSQFTASLRWDSISAGYVLLSIATLVRAYILATRRVSANGWSNLFGLPGYIYGFCGLIGGTLYLGLNLIDHFSHSALAISWRWVIFMLGAGVIGSLYVFACRLVFRAPLLVAEMWENRPRSYEPGSRRSGLI
jgi:hypothetical protein